ncbi:LysR family transcriptional regulator [Vreelandella venusta]|uniref:LysR family transcriptional regulator n=1 Tax=Vreelandella venusta TaxID=44935 RepID=A0ABX2BEA8_9GAMM|nr:LysR family transcriptional regulator [Halomonas venusta]AZM97469.1 LysR family transcriptional regulator [Halomonas venusta]MDW0358874.1 LysR family transcriptional regulator [Halomonas venusta]MDX1356658.1 LysR family transcriptional regulator [Halomonas venusta]MDX1714257.1 LysR family transcriptional regulator [Halomonas venusta]NPT31293.1 LysR family transcriptional regulator [Halomonas venusta]
MRSLRHFDLNLLLVFEALMRERHVTRAAEKLHLSQPALSHALKRLRDALDDPLLIRTNNGLQPTPRALALLPVVQQALAMLQEGLAPPINFLPATSERHFTLATTDYFEEVMYPAFVSQLLAYAPDISFSIELITPNVLSEGLEQRQVDMVVGLDSQSVLPSGVIQHLWMDEELVCLAATDNDRVGDALTIQQFACESHVALSDISGLRPSNIDNCLVQHGLNRRVISKNLNYIAAARVVALTDAIMTLPRQMAERFITMLPVRIVAPPKELPALNMTLIQHGLYANDPALIWLTQSLIEFASTFKLSAAKQ